MNYTKLFNESYNRAVICNSVDFFAEFYQIFFNKSPDIKRMFSATDMASQQRMLMASVMLIASFAKNLTSDSRMEKMARVHHELGVSLRQYDLWMEAILETLAKVDPLHTPAHTLAWRIMLSPGITYMKNANSDLPNN